MNEKSHFNLGTMLPLVLLFVQYGVAMSVPVQVGTVDEDVTKWLGQYNSKGTVVYFNSTQADWHYETNITNENAQASAEGHVMMNQFNLNAAHDARQFDLSQVTNEASKRSLRKILDVGEKLGDNDTTLLSNTINQMTGIYSSAKICSWDSSMMMTNCSEMWTLDDNLTDMIANSGDYDLMSYVWTAWRDAAGKPLSDLYDKMVNISNKGSMAGGYDDTGALWRSAYDVPGYDLQADTERLWNELVPLYEELHTYVRKQMRNRFMGRFSSSAMPAHTLGDMWAQSWVNVFNWTAPFPNKAPIDVTNEMLKQNFTALKMFHTADDFFKSLGLIPMNDEFYKCSLMTKPTDREVVCHASAWDFYDGKKFCIKMCAHVNMNDLVTIHHEMGHIEYFMQYANQSLENKNGANPGFHEAIGGDTMALSVNTPAHLHAIGLLPDYVPDEEQDINYLYRQALEKLAFLPFGYLVDQWRWDVFNETVDKAQWNEHWWMLRNKYQGIVPPVPRRNTDFDPGAKYHVPANAPYIRYFVSYVVQFQFYKAMCDKAGHEGPLHQCDFYKNEDAGALLASMLELGASKPWPEALQIMTGEDRIHADAIKEYFQPLLEWLREQNAGECYGWGVEWPNANVSEPRCGKQYPTEEQRVEAWLESYNVKAGQVYHDMVFYQWANMLNETDHNTEVAGEYAAARSAFDIEQGKIASHFDPSKITDEEVKRELARVSTVGLAFTHNQSLQFNGLVHEMSTFFDQGYVCAQNCSAAQCASDKSCHMTEDPHLELIMAESVDYDELEYYWVGWRNVTGRKARPLYKEYIDLGNQGAKQSGLQDMGQWWRSPYEDPYFTQQLEKLWRQVLPLYEQLHTYVRRKARMQYAGRFTSNAIPAHLLGNMWAQEWNNIYNWTVPYPEVPTVDVTEAMVDQNYTALRMFELAQSFYESIDLHKMNPSFWNISMIEKPADRDNVECYADSEDFYNAKDFGVAMCTKVRMEDLITIHHEMGHIEYFMSYDKQPIKFRDGANPGFHEAIGDTIALSVATPKHLNRIQLLNDTDYQPNNTEQQINFLYKQALSKIAFLPFGYLIDNYRWKLFDGSIPKDKMNEGWWSMRYQYQGLVPPVNRTEEDFDAGAKFHVDANVPYIRYFVSFVIQFQFHQALCKKAGHKGALSQCDIYNNTEAGDLLKQMLEMGASRPWPEAMNLLTGQNEMSSEPLVEYFKPLLEFLKEENSAAGDCYGWGYVWPDYYDLAMPRCSKESSDDSTTTTMEMTTGAPDMSTTTNADTKTTTTTNTVQTTSTPCMVPTTTKASQTPLHQKNILAVIVGLVLALVLGK